MSDILKAIGNTPIVKLKNIVPIGCGEIYVKLEAFNPTGSKKDRMALSMILGAEKRGILKKGMTVVEYSGGSTGAGLAFVCSLKGYNFRLVTADVFGKEKIDLMRSLGANLEIIKSSDNPNFPNWKKSFLDDFGLSLANVIDILDPDVIILGGGVSNIDFLYSEGKNSVYEKVFSDIVDTPITKNELGDSAGVFGACML